MLSDEAAFVRNLSENPGDFAAYLVFADWLQEQRRPVEADACRWLAQRERRPYQRSDRKTYRWVWTREGRFDRPLPGRFNLRCPTCVLPRVVYQHLGKRVDARFQSYHTWQEAFSALANSLETIRRIVRVS